MRARTARGRRLAHPTVERLCEHHVVGEFQSGKPELDGKLGLFQHRFGRGEDVLVFVLVEDTHEVLAYVAIGEGAFRAEKGRDVVHGLSIPAIAVSEKASRGSFKTLVEAAEAAIEVRRETTDQPKYEGIICMPELGTPLAKYLELRGFGPVEGHPTLYWRAFDS